MSGAKVCDQTSGRSIDVSVSLTAAVSDAKSDARSLDVLVNTPDCAARTGITISHEPALEIDPSVNDNACVPTTAVSVPLQVLVEAGVLATSSPAGRVLVKLMSATSINPPELSMSKVRKDV